MASTCRKVMNDDGKTVHHLELECDLEVPANLLTFRVTTEDDKLVVEEHYKGTQHGSEKAGGTEEGGGRAGAEETPPAIEATGEDAGAGQADRVILGLHFKR